MKRAKVRARLARTLGNPQRGWPVLVLFTLTCGGLKGGDSHRRGGDDVEVSQSRLVNPLRGENGIGPRQDINHIAPQSPVNPGTIEGTSEVRDGVYRYSIPIHLPSGRAGLKPEIGLAYSSSAGNGPVGVGWAITGTSLISRCAHTVSRDGFAAGFDFAEDYESHLNQYCLDGNKLVPFQRSGDTVVYQTENANFARITAFFNAETKRDPEYFVVENRDGTISEYGHDRDANTFSRADGPLGGVMTSSGTDHWTYAWHLSEIRDRNDNKITFSYRRDQGSDYAHRHSGNLDEWYGQTRYISMIKYGQSSVRFDYEVRPDQNDSFAFGFDLSMNWRLTAIRIDTDDHSEWTWRYVLSYAQSVFTNRSELTKIQLESEGSAEVLPPTTFTWNTFIRPDGPHNFGTTNDYQITSYDLGGSCSTDPSACLPRNSTRLLLADINADGRDDVIYTLNDTALEKGARLKVRLATASGLGPEIDSTNIAASSLVYYLDTALTADFDGDGADELIFDYRANDTALATRDVVRWNGSTFEPLPSSSLRTLLAGSAVSWNENRLRDPMPIQVADFNGDGLLDLLAGGSLINHPKPGESEIGARHKVHFGTLDSLDRYGVTLGPEGPPPDTGKRKTVHYGDADGDGRADVIRIDGDRKGIFFADVNGDGLTDQFDFVRMSSSDDDCGGRRVRFQVKENTGRIPTWLTTPSQTFFEFDRTIDTSAGQGTCVPIGIEDLPFPKLMDMDYADSVRVGDFNGDGFQDLLLLNVGVDAGIQFYSRDRGEHTSGLFLCGSRTVCDDDGTNCQTYGVGCSETNHRKEVGKGHFSPPVLLMSTGSLGGEGFIPVVLPVSGGRFREEQYATSPNMRDEYGDLVAPEGGWGSHYWSGTAVGDIDGDGLSDIVQLALSPDGGRVVLETITGRKKEISGLFAVPHRRDVIVAVQDGLRNLSPAGADRAERISYGDLSSLTGKKHHLRHPQFCIPAASGNRTSCLTKGFVVDAHVPMGRLKDEAIAFDYESGRYDRQGRGFLGFDVVTATDGLLGVSVTTSRRYFEQVRHLQDDFGITEHARSTLVLRSAEHFPRYVDWDDGLEQPLRVRKYWPSETTTTTTRTEWLLARPPGGKPPIGSRRPLSRVTHHTQSGLRFDVSNGTSYTAANTFLVLSGREEITDDYIAEAENASVTSPPDIEKTVVPVYDDYGNRKQVTTTTTGGMTDVQVTDYDNDTKAWLLGQARHVVHTRSDAQRSVARTTDYSYHKNGLVATKTVEPNRGELRLLTEYFYDVHGNIETLKETGLVDAAATQTRTTTTTYEKTGLYPYQITNGLKQTTTLTFDPKFDVKISEVDANGVGTDFVYDLFGRQRAVFPDDGQAVKSYLRPGDDLSEFEWIPYDPNVAFRESIYTSQSGTPEACAGNQHADNGRCFAHVGRIVVDLRGNPVKTSQVKFWNFEDVDRAYDSRNRLQSVTEPLQGGETVRPATTYGYDGLDRMIDTTDPGSFTKRSQYPDRFTTIETGNAGDQVTKKVDKDDRLASSEETVTDDSGPHTVRTEFAHEPFDAVSSVKRFDSTGAFRATGYQYDNLGRLTLITDPTSGARSMFRNAFGEVWQEIDGISGVRSVTRDVLGRVTAGLYLGGGTTSSESYTWDTAPGSGIGKLHTAVRMPDNVVQTYEYNSLGLLYKRRMAAQGEEFSFAFYYDSEGRHVRTFFPKPASAPSALVKTRNTYNDSGALVEVGSYNPIEQALWRLTLSTPSRTVETFGDGSTTESLRDNTTRRLTDINFTLGSTRNVHYTHHPDGKLASMRKGGATESYVYDELDRLKTWTRAAVTSLRREYSYNDFGDLLGTKTFNATTGGTQTASESYSFGVTTPRAIASAVSSDGVSTYGYDGMGRRTSKTTSGIPAPESVGYNNWSLPTFVGSPAGTLTFKYDAFGRRAVKIFNSEVTYYVDDIFELRIAADGTRTNVVHVKADGKTVAEVSQVSSSGTGAITPVYLHQDVLGSTSVVTAGTFRTGFFYEPFGALFSTVGPLEPVVHHDFTGHERDQFGLINMRGRIYDPALRRFLTPDPVVVAPTLSQGYNRYSYVQNNPTNLVDPTGYASDDMDLGVAGSGRSRYQTTTTTVMINETTFITTTIIEDLYATAGPGASSPTPTPGSSARTAPPSFNAAAAYMAAALLSSPHLDSYGAYYDSRYARLDGYQDAIQKNLAYIQSFTNASPPIQISGRDYPVAAEWKSRAQPPPRMGQFACRVDGGHIAQYNRAYETWSNEQLASQAGADINHDALFYEHGKLYSEAIDGIEGSWFGVGAGYMSGFDPRAVKGVTGVEMPGSLDTLPGGDGPGADNVFSIIGTYGEKGKNNPEVVKPKAPTRRSPRGR